MEIVNKIKSFEDIVLKYHDLVGNDFKEIKEEVGLEDSQKIQKTISSMQKDGRVLKIGIVGRVKAGKSSLLNALLFDGKSILPKAATPMTASLTTISYAKELFAEVEFFKKEDIENIKQEAKEYELALEKAKERILLELKEKSESKIAKIKNKFKDTELKEKAEKRAIRELKDSTLTASYEQWQMMKASGVDFNNLSQHKTIKSSSVEELSKTLIDFVGADGKYMPFTKSVNIKLPFENLKDIEIIDTPGVNDPVQSREARTRELLKECDVVFIVSPSGQFMSSEDLDLMDRITSKEGIRELYVIASQADTQLFGSIKYENDGDLQKVLNQITNNLANHLHNTLINLKKTNPEVGDTYDSLIEQSSKKIIYSSGICHSLSKSFDEKELWDEGMKKVWENLTKYYPDYFSENDKNLSVANLNLLANISAINSIIESVKDKKEQILQKRVQEYLEAKQKAIFEFEKKILKYIDEKIEEIKTTNLDELIKEQEKLKYIKEEVSDAVDEEYKDIVESMKRELKDRLYKELRKYFKESENKIDDAEGSEDEIYKVEEDGIGSWFARKLWGGGYETRSRVITTIRTGAVKSSLEDLTFNIEDMIESSIEDYKENWKKKLSSGILEVLRENINDDDLNPRQIKNVLKSVIRTIELPNITYSGNIPDSLNARGTLKGDNAEEYIAEAQNYMNDLHIRVKNDIKNYIEEFMEKLLKIKISDKIFEKYYEKLNELENQIKNKEIIIDRFNLLKKDIKKVV